MNQQKGGNNSKKDLNRNEFRSNGSEGSINSLDSQTSIKDYKNMYWTRVIALHHYQMEQDQVFPVQEDYEIEKLGFDEALLDN